MLSKVTDDLWLNLNNISEIEFNSPSSMRIAEQEIGDNEWSFNIRYKGLEQFQSHFEGEKNFIAMKQFLINYSTFFSDNC